MSTRAPALFALVAAAAVAVAGCAAAGDGQMVTVSSSWPGCATFSTQPEAQAAWKTAGRPARADGDGDQRVCESLPAAASSSTAPSSTSSGAKTQGCKRPKAPLRIVYSRGKYRNITRHIEDAWAKGYPRVLRINRIGTSERRDKLLNGIPTRPGMDRDEYPPAVARGKRPGIDTGVGDTEADVRYVPSSENRSAGSVLGGRIGRLCDGARFTFTIRP